MQEGEKKIKKCHRRGEDKSAIAVTQIKDLDSCSMGSISHAEAWMLPQHFRIQNYCACGREGDFSTQNPSDSLVEMTHGGSGVPNNVREPSLRSGWQLETAKNGNVTEGTMGEAQMNN